MQIEIKHPHDHLVLPIQETPYDFAAIFGNPNPVELEVGSGKGRFLIGEAEANPDRNYVGIEWANKYCQLCASRAAGRKMTNIRFLRDDAVHTFKMAISDRCLEAVYVLFPDPWPKKRQLKRRTIQAPFLDQVARTVKVGGKLVLATDHAEYFEQMVEVTAAHPKIQQVLKLVGEEARTGVTNFEVKYRAEGRVIHNLDCEVLG